MPRFVRFGLSAALLILPVGLLFWSARGLPAAPAPKLETLELLSGGAPFTPPSPAQSGTRSPSALLFRPDGNLLYLTEQNENKVTLLDPNEGKVNRPH